MKKTSSSLLLKISVGIGFCVLISSGRLQAAECRGQGQNGHDQQDQNFDQTGVPVVIPPNKFSSRIHGLVITWRQEEKTNLILNFAGTIVAKAYKRQSQAGKKEWGTDFLMPAMPKEYREWEEVLEKISKESEQISTSVQEWEATSGKNTGSSVVSTVHTGDMAVDKEATFLFDFAGSAQHDSEVYSDFQSLNLNSNELGNPEYWQGKAIFPAVLQFVMQKLADYERQDIDWDTIEAQGLELAQKSIGSQMAFGKQKEVTHVKK